MICSTTCQLHRTDMSGVWTTVSHTFRDFGHGLTYIVWRDGGRDTEVFAGQTGPLLDSPQLVRLHMSMHMHMGMGMDMGACLDVQSCACYSVLWWAHRLWPCRFTRFRFPCLKWENSRASCLIALTLGHGRQLQRWLALSPLC